LGTGNATIVQGVVDNAQPTTTDASVNQWFTIQG
jgi:hypothetical protein